LCIPVAIPNPSGEAELAVLHRPLFPGTRPQDTACRATSRELDIDRESIWISYRPFSLEPRGPSNPRRVFSSPAGDSGVSLGATENRLGTPPVLTRHGWLIVYHGVSEPKGPSNEVHPLCYSAGVMVLSKEHPQVIRYRSTKPVLTPELPQERRGTVANVVFPTGIDRRDDVGLPARYDVYYGMADYRIGVARLDVPDALPPGGLAAPLKQRCNLQSFSSYLLEVDAILEEVRAPRRRRIETGVVPISDVTLLRGTLSRDR
jgi:hypothetical protein